MPQNMQLGQLETPRPTMSKREAAGNHTKNRSIHNHKWHWQPFYVSFFGKSTSCVQVCIFKADEAYQHTE
ncbi:hypothetical protein ACFX1S_003939 [Malus domestica]